MEYKFEKIAFNSTAKKLPEESDRQHYIGLEHLDTNSLFVSRWGSEVTPVGEKLLMKKGDILFGKRRAYQRKVGIAPFDGIFSAHGMVLRPKEDVMDKDYFPFFISSDQFMERAVRISVGGLSPTINWKDLKEQVFDIPSLDEQKSLAAKLWAAYKLREEYKRLLAATDEMVKSRFIEEFQGKGYQSQKLSSIAQVVTGSTPSRSVSDYWLCGTHPWVSAQDMSDKFVDATAELVSDLGMATCKLIPAGSLLYVCRGSIGVMSINRIDCATNQSICSAICDVSICKTEYLYYWLLYHEDEINSLGEGTSFKSLSQKTFASLEIQIPPIEEQLRFIEITRQADKSKFELKQAIEKIDKVMRALMQ